MGNHFREKKINDEVTGADPEFFQRGGCKSFKANFPGPREWGRGRREGGGCGGLELCLNM